MKGGGCTPLLANSTEPGLKRRAVGGVDIVNATQASKSNIARCYNAATYRGHGGGGGGSVSGGAGGGGGISGGGG